MFDFFKKKNEIKSEAETTSEVVPEEGHVPEEEAILEVEVAPEIETIPEVETTPEVEAEPVTEAEANTEMEVEEASEVDTEVMPETEVASETEFVDKPTTSGGFFARLKSGLQKTKEGFVKGLDQVFNGSLELSEEFYEELEELLIMGDVGVEATEEILDELQSRVDQKRIREPKETKDLLKEIIKEKLEATAKEPFDLVSPTVILVVGVNGVGKTTTIGKLAGKYASSGKKVVIAAADTFRAAAVDQLRQWAERANVDMVGGQEGSDPASVVFDAIASAKAKNADVLLIDTAGRLHNKKNLMQELAKINRIVDREYGAAKRETFCVLDATTGQNALIQAKEFNESSPLSGLVLTKMDGTAKGGIVVAICTKLSIPVRYIGVGEKQEDLSEFNEGEFVEALFS